MKVDIELLHAYRNRRGKIETTKVVIPVDDTLDIHSMQEAYGYPKGYTTLSCSKIGEPITVKESLESLTKRFREKFAEADGSFQSITGFGKRSGNGTAGN